MIEQVLYSKELKDVFKSSKDFINGSIDAKKLFSEFRRAFGPILVYKYFYFYINTLKGNQEIKECNAVL